MNKTMSKSILLVLIAVISLVMVTTISKAGVKGSKHDLSSTGPEGGVKTDGTDQVCVFCHTPHFSSNTVPLWNRNNSAVTNYTLYSSATLVATPAQPGGISAACLSCHDGTVAFDSLLNKPGSGTGAPTWEFTGAGQTSGKMTGASTKLGTNLSDDHPISFAYLASAKLNTATDGKVGGLPLFSNKVECASCHNVHEWGSAGTTAPFLRATNAGSALCLTCHIK
ncbi:MAG: cytochrome c3 family protein [Smithellaceae bacterium]|nr:cytochrome c3 family protein [Smithellaceae bacterium]